MDLLDTHKLILDFWDNDNNRIHITSSSIVSQLHLRCLKMSNSAPSRLPPQEWWLGWPTLGPTLGKRLGKRFIVKHVVHGPTPCKSCSLCSCAMCLLHFVMRHVCRGVLCTVCVYWTSVAGSREIWRQPILLLPALSKTSLWNNHYGAKRYF